MSHFHPLHKVGQLFVKSIVPMFFGFSAISQAEPLKVLFIGNSYTHMNDMPSIFEKIAKKAGKDVIVEKNTLAGASFSVHSERNDMYEAINKRKWDYVVLQGYSRELSFPCQHIDTATIPYLTKITDSIYTNNPCTQILFYMTWGYDEGFSEREEVNSFDKMADSIERGYQYLGAIFDVPVVPVGMVWKNVRNSTGINLYASDKAHPNKNGSYLIASTFYNAVFNESIKNVFTGTIPDTSAVKIKEQMERYMGMNKLKYRLNENRYDVRKETTRNGEFVIHFTSNFPDACSVRWSFGDGTYSNLPSGEHVFKKEGTYKMKYTVDLPCGVRNFTSSVTFDPIKQPVKRKHSKPQVTGKNGRKS